MSSSESSSASDNESTSSNHQATDASHSAGHTSAGHTSAGHTSAGHTAHKSTNGKHLAEAVAPTAKKLVSKFKGEKSKETESSEKPIVANPGDKEKTEAKKPIINKEHAATAAPIAKKIGKKIAQKAKKQAGGGSNNGGQEEAEEEEEDDDDDCCGCF